MTRCADLSILLALLCLLFASCAGDDASTSSGPATDDDLATDDDDDDNDDNDTTDDDDDDDDDDNDDTTPLPPPTVKTLSWIARQDDRLMDEYGRQWLVRGINARIKGLFDPTEDWGEDVIPEFTAEDCPQMAQDGFNLLRLAVNWSALEPVEGEFNEDAYAQVAQIVEWCRQAGVYTLIDSHQDRYSKYIGDDGAPLWAIYPPFTPEEDVADGLNITWRQFAAVFAFFVNFDGIQERFLPAWRKLIAPFVDRPEVIGFEPYNEPAVIILPALYAFYERATAALRELDARHTVWLESDSTRNNLLWTPLRPEPFPDDNVVYTPHMYPNFIGMNYQTPEEWVAALDDSFAHLIKEADSWVAAPAIDEWGTNPYDSYAEAYFTAMWQLCDKYHLGQAFWLWKERSGGWWGLFDYDSLHDTWTHRAGPAVDALLRPSAMAVPGRLVEQSFDVDTATLTVTFEAKGGEAAPLLYLPASWYPAGATILVDGEAAACSIDADTQRSLVPWDEAAGAHEIVVTPN